MDEKSGNVSAMTDSSVEVLQLMPVATTRLRKSDVPSLPSSSETVEGGGIEWRERKWRYKAENTAEEEGEEEEGSDSGEHFHQEEHLVDQRFFFLPNFQVADSNKVLTSFIAGAVAGALAKTTIAPLDRTKINFQITNKPFSAREAVSFLYNTVKQTGFLSLYRGNSATLIRIIPYAAIQFSSHEQYKIWLNKDNKKHLPPLRRFLAGCLAGITSSAITYPLDLCRARMAVTAKNQYKHIGQVFMKMYRQEGFRSIYRGFTPTILGVIPYSGSSFFTYETLKMMHAERHQGRDPTLIERMVSGAVAGIVGQCVSYPLDIVRRTMQTAGVTGHTLDYVSIMGTARCIFAEEGLRGLYKGLSMNYVKGPLAVGMSFASFDTIKLGLRKLPYFQDGSG